jgi:hypothetical protein
MLFHDQAMLKNISVSPASVRNGVGMVRGIGEHIAIFAGLSPTFPGWVLVAVATVHRVLFTLEQVAFAIHRIILAAHISMVGWISRCFVASRHLTTDRTILAMKAFVVSKGFAAVLASDFFLGSLAKFNPAAPVAKAAFFGKARLQEKRFSTLLARTFNLDLFSRHHSSRNRHVMFAGIIP